MSHETFTPFQTQMVESYDTVFAADPFFLKGERAHRYANLGLFLPGTPDHATACDNMMARLLGFIADHRGPVLDVGCGMGATTQYLSRFYPSDQVHGVNISEYQLDICRRHVPESHFHLMPAENLDFPDETFQAVISVEAAPHFKGRRDFLRNAFRVLKPGGDIVISDMIFHAEPRNFRKVLSGQEIYSTIDAYRTLWVEAGFSDFAYEDITVPCWKGYVHYLRTCLLHQRMNALIDDDTFARHLRFAEKLAKLPVTAYVLVHARKPVVSGT